MMSPEQEWGGCIGDYSLSYKDVEWAQARLRMVAHRTPLSLSRTFSEMTSAAVYLKMENMQKTGAFKIRGAFNKVAALSSRQREKGVITASAGNHAQGVALAAQHFGVHATVVMPAHAPETKVSATKGYGAQVVLTGDNYDEAYEAALELSLQQGATFVHAFDDPDVIAGQGTIGMEIMEDLPNVEDIVVPVGGGGLISGIALAVKQLWPHVRVIGVQPAGSDAGYRSWHSGTLQHIEHPHSVADGLSVKTPGKLTFAMMRRFVDDFVLVSDKEIEQAMCLMLERAKVLVEGAGAAALAALLSERLHLQGRKVAVVVSGGNVDLTRVSGLTAQFAGVK